ncbi:hypothetical protein D3C75_1131730 [compost metagenome]
MRTQRKLILLAATNGVFLRQIFGGDAHVIIVEGIPQAVLDHAVSQLTVTQPQPGTRAVHQIRRLTHTFLPPGDNHFGVTTADRLHRQMNRLQTGATDFVDG